MAEYRSTDKFHQARDMPVPPSSRQDEAVADRSLASRLESSLVNHATVMLGISLTLGVAIGWLIKRR